MMMASATAAEVGFELFERETGGVKFTEKGLAFVRHCQNILDEMAFLDEDAPEEPPARV